MSYKWCVVPQCKNTSLRNPEKVFVSVPTNAKRRNKWLQLARRDPTSISSHTNVFMCEDHFDMEKDSLNYMKYKMGFSKKILLTEDALPKRFHCQEDRKRRICDSEHSRDVFAKRRRMDLIQEYEKEICLPTKNSMSTFEEDINMPQDIIIPDEDFNPETSTREKRKLNRKSYFNNRKCKRIYNERGHLNATGEDLCDCLDKTCPGCHFPCPKCNSNKCGHECRVNRKWMYEKIEIEGNDEVVKNTYNK